MRHNHAGNRGTSTRHSSIRGDLDTLSEPLAKALDQDKDFVSELLEQLDNLFVTES